MWHVEFSGSEVCRCYMVSNGNYKHGQGYKSAYSNRISIFVEAKDEEHAKKIAKDMYIKWLAEQNNL